MAVRLIVVERSSHDPLVVAAADYLQRLQRHVRAEALELDVARRLKGSDDEKVRLAEAEALRKAVRGTLVALDKGGQQLTSEALAQRLAGWLQAGDVSFVIGGATGLHAGLLREAAFILSLGTLTLAHRVARLVLCEQLYRAMTILKHEPYHK